MENKNHDERIRKAGDNHVELMDLTFRMHMTEDVDFHEVMDLIREIYKDQLTLINLLNKYESENNVHAKSEKIQIPEFAKAGVQ